VILLKKTYNKFTNTFLRASSKYTDNCISELLAKVTGKDELYWAAVFVHCSLLMLMNEWQLSGRVLLRTVISAEQRDHVLMNHKLIITVDVITLPGR